jgi:hypothetical protein
MDEVVLDGTLHPSWHVVIDGGKWMTLKEISARLKKVFKGAYAEDEGSYIKIGNYLNRPECQFLSDRKSFGMVYWVKER